MFHTSRYSALPRDSEEGLEKANNELRVIQKPSTSFTLRPILLIVLVVSLAFNILTLAQKIDSSKHDPSRPNYANLRWNVPTTFQPISQFNDPDPDIQDAAWKSDIVRPMNFVVALDEDYAASLGLVHSMRWPWDHKKGVYVVHAGHKLHCLHLLRQAAQDTRDNVEQRWSYSHKIHCIEMFLQDEMCDADDTLMYTGFLHDSANATGSVVGAGTKRVCRDWSKLRAWADENSACYNPSYELGNPNITEIDRYKFCPNGERPWEKAL